MLERLKIKNLAIIEDLDLAFDAGLNVITGETGAGKSIIVNSIKLLLGARASSRVIRHGAVEAEVTGVFQGGHQYQLLKDQMGIEADDILIVKRIINKTGKNRAFINGEPATLQMLQQVVLPLITLSGQHENQSLISPEYQLNALDEFAQLKPERQKWEELYELFVKYLQEKDRLLKKMQELKSHQELLEFQIKEIEQAHLTVDEEELQKEREKLRHLEFLKDVASRAFWELYEADDAIVSKLSRLKKAMEEAGVYDSYWQNWVRITEECLYQLQDVAQAVKDYEGGLFFEPQRLQQIEDQLAEIERLKRKYQVSSVKELLELQKRFLEELNHGQDIEARLELLEKELQDLRTQLVALAQVISRKRKKAAGLMAERMINELKELGMPHVRVEIKLEPVKKGIHLTPEIQVKETGAEEAMFYFSANPGEPLSPLGEVISGGELSRFLLVLKGILGHTTAETIVFDEVDTGVGGDIGRLIGQKLKQLAQRQQVICITHLPQIASQADAHFKVEKQVISGRTLTTVIPLNKEQRLAELTRMLGGQPELKSYARALLEGSMND